MIHSTTFVLIAVAATLMCAAADPNDAPRPAYDGRFEVSGLAAPLAIDRDARAMPTIRAASIEDALFGLGFTHAQERLFAMDAARRFAAGELAEIAGPAALEIDRERRRFRFRHIARQVVDRLPDDQRRLLDKYVAGVNAGMDVAETLPIEHRAIGANVSPWSAEDSVLIVLSMYDLLHIEARLEKMIGIMHATLPAELVEFLTPIASRFDTPLLPDEAPVDPLPIPRPETVDLRNRAGADLTDGTHASKQSSLAPEPPAVPGSNGWAVAGSRTVHGGAILASDPHLPYSVPGLWYRAELHWPGGFAVGLTIPGAPGVIIGSNGDLAWGVTNTTGDFQDLIVVDVHPNDPTCYRTADGWEAFDTVTEEILVRGRGVVTIELTKTRWGIITDEDHEGRPLVLKWTALEPECTDMSILHLMTATSLERGLDIAAAWGGPSQNMQIASRDGRVGWVVTGRLPRRVGFSGRRPVSWADGSRRWDGYFDGADRPRLIDPPDGLVFTANNRTVDVDWAQRMGGIWASGECAWRVADVLRSSVDVDERDMLALQLDTRVEGLDFYRDLALEAIESLPEHSDDEVYAARLLRAWNGRADVDSAAMRIVVAFQGMIREATMSGLVAPARELDPEFQYFWLMSEEPLRRILETRPEHLRPGGDATWKHVLQRAWRGTMALVERGDRTVATPWGDVNRVQMPHLFSRIIPGMAKAWGMPEDRQPGHRSALRVASPQFGASARLVVSPGREDEGLLHLPAGQSGHPDSPHYRDGHADWLHGRATPLRPGRAAHTLHLKPSMPDS